MAAAADVPNIYDLVIGSKGYILANQVAPNLPFRTQRAKYGYTPTFIQRQNTSGDYGDNQQDFWLTAAQRDWSLGEEQKFFKATDPLKERLYYVGSYVDISIPGEVSMGRLTGTVGTGGATVKGAGSGPVSGGFSYTSSTTNLYKVSSNGTCTDLGAHGCGGYVTAYATDGVYLYLSGAACTKTRKMLLSSFVISDFSATPTESLVFLNNTLYGCNAGVFYTIATTGVATASFTWKDATGTTLAGAAFLLGYGGKVLIIRTSGSANGTEIWQWDGTGVSKLADFGPDFVAQGGCVQAGIVFLVGVENPGIRCSVWSYNAGTLARVFLNNTSNSGGNIGCSIAPFGRGVIFTDFLNGLRYYDLSTAGVSTVASYPQGTAGKVTIVNNGACLLMTNESTSPVIWPSSTNATTTSVTSSIIDYDSSLTKLFRGVIVDWVGSFGTVDIAYQVDDINSSGYTALKTGAVSGTEYPFPANTTGRGVSIKVTMNRGASFGPTVKRVYVRAAPILQKFRTAEYVVDMTGRDGKTPVVLRNGNASELDGKDMLASFLTNATSASPLTFTDRLGTYTGVVDLATLEIIEIRPEEYMVRFSAREV